MFTFCGFYIFVNYCGIFQESIIQALCLKLRKQNYKEGKTPGMGKKEFLIHKVHVMSF